MSASTLRLRTLDSQTEFHYHRDRRKPVRTRVRITVKTWVDTSRYDGAKCRELRKSGKR